jgi:formylglycine-generating enzyme
MCVRTPITAGTFSIDATEVTKGQYVGFLQATGGVTSGQPAFCSWNTSYQPSAGWPPSVGDYDMPAAWVDWCDAYAYCAWAGRRLCGKIGGGTNPSVDYANPALSQWMGACVGPSGFGFPYGNTYIASRCNNAGAGIGTAVSVGQLTGCVGGYPGLYDMSGNVMEWEDSCLASSDATDLCRNRGGSYTQTNDDASGIFTRCDTNNNNARNFSGSSLGFRCCN